MELIRAAEILIDRIRRDYKDDIALVVLLGSYIYNDTHSRSDLDMFYVPNTDRGRDLSITFIVDGIGFDYWAISWERLERIAAFEERSTSIITEGRVIYYSLENDLKRFLALKTKALDTSDRRSFVDKAGKRLDEAYKHYWSLLGAKNLSDARISCIGILDKITFALALLNRITVKRGGRRLKQEILDMPLVPDDFSTLFETVFRSCDIPGLREVYGQLLENTAALISRERETLGPAFTFASRLGGLYEELINFYNKIYHACETQDPHTALTTSVMLTNEILEAFDGTGVSPAALPDIVGAFDPEHLERLTATAKEHQARFVRTLKENDVPIRDFASFDELERYIGAL